MEIKMTVTTVTLHEPTMTYVAVLAVDLAVDLPSSQADSSPGAIVPGVEPADEMKVHFF